MEHTIRFKADNPKRGMTAGELRAFAMELRDNFSDDDVLRVTTNLQRGIKTIEVTGGSGNAP